MVTELIKDLEALKKGAMAFKEMRDDMKKAMDVIDKFNKNSKSMLKTLEKLATIMERNETTVKKLVDQLEKMDKNMATFAGLLSLLGEEESKGKK